ncbi:chorismate mutase ARO7 KNAG_0H00740 [Huiozyma naganishii CBS 8797]|uniref:Chorismate mutase n=1 Tax=Huiozyma naganishii (strain ATCC MYA-139 / BCRC 22969 / CBS 8797 / KCTC 17520 / NBRC 10181 / NCYC 3082 / Yp74L-3) TaxID=1071383 RepID=J7S8E8_HUIN7|nr:hypothetical protein KNAG_0H00740 [Kazachstania naganishii CBS 8797]CCK71489.1 hypothetical protein KNAG_0H00740 [Kazachstania naganishii CBS 8797]
MDFTNPASVLDLNNIRAELVKMEDSIIFKFIERSHFATCPGVYTPNNAHLHLDDFHGSFLDWLLVHLEITQSQIRRYTSPDQTPFFPDKIKESILPAIDYPQVLGPQASAVNYNDTIKQVYIDKMVPLISKLEDDDENNYGSVASCDIECLQALSRRIHFGKFVAEAKFRNDVELYTDLIKRRDIQGIVTSITNSAVEEKILQRLTTKAEVYGVDPTNKEGERRITPEYLVKIYKEYVIPLTKDVEVEYLLKRLEDVE